MQTKNLCTILGTLFLILYIASSSFAADMDKSAKNLEIAENNILAADYPVIIFPNESEAIENGTVIGNVQYVTDYDEVIAIVHTNDTHGFIKNEAYVKGHADSLKASGNYDMVLTINAGDVWGGGNVAAHGYDGELIPKLMGMVYDIMTPGNADVSLPNTYYSMALLSALGDSEGVKCLLANQVATADFDMVAFAGSYKPVIDAELMVELYSALVLNSDGTIDWSSLHLEDYSAKSGESPLDGTMIVTTPGGSKIGFYGMTWFGRGGALEGRPSIKVSQDCADKLRTDGCTAVIGIIHTGYPDNDPSLMATSTNDTNSVQIALNTTGIDVLIDAHTHSIINGGKGILFGDKHTYINQAYAYGEAIGVMTLYLKNGVIIAKSGELITDYANIMPDTTAQAYVDFVMNKLDEDGYTTILAETSVFLNGERSSANNIGGGVRMNETNLGDFITDGVLAIANELWEGGVDIAMYPGYWVRASAEAGPITKTDISSFFANTTAVYYREYTARELVEQMQESIKLVGLAENNQFKQISGFKVTYIPETEQNTLYSIAVGDTLVYQNGKIMVGNDWTCSCAYTLTNPDAQSPAEHGWDPANEIIGTKTELTDRFCQYLLNYDPVIYNNVIAPDDRVTAYK